MDPGWFGSMGLASLPVLGPGAWVVVLPRISQVRTASSSAKSRFNPAEAWSPGDHGFDQKTTPHAGASAVILNGNMPGMPGPM